MLELTTKRLRIIPLDKRNLEFAITDFNKMEKALGLTITDKNIGPREREVFRIRLRGVKFNESQYMWYTVWAIVLQEENRIIGHAMLKGAPNDKGEVIIGYYMQEPYRGNGYMKEAASEIISWIFENQEVKYVVADTVKDNNISQRLLKDLGMELYNEDKECYWWRLKNSNH